MRFNMAFKGLKGNYMHRFNNELHNLGSAPDIIRLINTMSVLQVRHATCK
jgi:urease alpha subunit